MTIMPRIPRAASIQSRTLCRFPRVRSATAIIISVLSTARSPMPSAIGRGSAQGDRAPTGRAGRLSRVRLSVSATSASRRSGGRARSRHPRRFTPRSPGFTSSRFMIVAEPGRLMSSLQAPEPETNAIPVVHRRPRNRGPRPITFEHPGTAAAHALPGWRPSALARVSAEHPRRARLAGSGAKRPLPEMDTAPEITGRAAIPIPARGRPRRQAQGLTNSGATRLERLEHRRGTPTRLVGRELARISTHGPRS